MRIAVVGTDHPDSFSDNVCDVLRSLGHDVHVAGPALPETGMTLPDKAISVISSVPAVEMRLQRRVVARCAAWEPDLVLSVQSLMPASVAALKRAGSKVALWFPDAVANLGRHEMFVAPYDGIFLKQPRVVERARSLLAAPVFYLPEACNPKWHRPIDGPHREPVVVVAGNMYPWRIRLLERLVAAAIPIKLFGTYWPSWISSPEVRKHHTGRYIAREDKAREFRAAAVVLNNLHPAEVDGYNCRLFEATGCGAAVLTERRAELEEFFDEGTEVEAFSSFDELVERARALIDDPDAGRKLGDAAATRAHAEHSYSHRLERIFELLA
ncbi:MAG: CgeB family protein [Actinomycetota bacterium]